MCIWQKKTNILFILLITVLVKGILATFSCPTNWTYMVGSNCCLRVFEGLAVNFQQAEDFCISEDSNLASIVDQYDVRFLISQFTGAPIWVGGYLSPTTGTYFWIDNTTWNSFDQNSLWSPGEPNNLGGDEDATELYQQGAINDIPHATINDGAACKIPIPPLVSCCPTGGVWSQWNAMDKCNASCGSCGVQSFNRTCYSASKGCSCSGKSTAKISCNPKFCVYPDNVCCKPFTKQIFNGKNICGPLQSLPL